MLLGLFFLAQQATAQKRALEISLLHTQTTLPWKKLPAHSLHPGLKLSYLSKKNPSKHWVREVQVGYLYHSELFKIAHAGYGFRYELFRQNNSFQLQPGFSIGPILERPVATAFENNNGEWEQTRAAWQLKGFASLMLKASYQMPGCDNLHVGAGISVWVQAPYVAQLTTILPHRNYEIALRYNFKTKNL